MGRIVPVYRSQMGLVHYCSRISERANSKSRKGEYVRGTPREIR